MDNELIERVARILRDSIESHVPSDADSENSYWARHAQAVLAELAGEIADCERYRRFRQEFGLASPYDGSIVWHEVDIEKAIDEARGLPPDPKL